MDVTRKDATITNTDESFPGAFEVVLSAPTLDRDGDTLASEDWKQPLPSHITFDSDHGMTVATTVGSGVPTIDMTGNLVVSGTYSSLPRAQEVRTLVNEGHIRTTSVAFMSAKSTKDGKTRTTRELLNGAFVAIPSNREALILSSKSAAPTPADVFGKAGARNSKTDSAHMQAAHDSLVAAGANCAPSDDTGAAEGATGGKAATDVTTKSQSDIGQLAQAVDAALDEAQNLLDGVDTTTLPAPVQQALGLISAAETAVDHLLQVLGVSDPDEDDAEGTPAAEVTTAAAVDDTAAAAAKSAAAEDIEMKYRALMVQITAEATE